MKATGSVQIGCTGIEEGYEIIYSFDKDYKLQNLRIAGQTGYGGTQHQWCVLGCIRV